MPTTDLEPLLRQYAHFKHRHPELVLLFRVGEFYEAFEADAQILHERLGLNLMHRQHEGRAVKLAGVPCPYVDGYIKRLLEAGYRVAKCDPVQPADVPAGEKVIREVAEDRLIEPGRLVEKAPQGGAV
jgi:DNA mismatch repair protein MutS